MFHNYGFKEWISLKKSSAPEFIGHKLAFAAIVTNYSICGDRGDETLAATFTLNLRLALTFKSSTCHLTGFFWLLNHVIYLKLTKSL